MEAIKLIALRDFAIQYLPRAQKVSTAMPADQYHFTLYGITALISSTAPAVHQAAAQLLQTVLSLLIEWGDDAKLTAQYRSLTELEGIRQAKELCTLTGTTIDWLPSLPLVLNPQPSLVATPLSPTPPPAPVHILQPGETQKTEVAAMYLGVTEQTMRQWASEGNGPLMPIKLGRRNGWPTAELIRLGREGWRPRGRKKS